MYSTRFVVNETGDALSGFVDEPLLNKMIASWKKEYGALLDFGGGIKDISCRQIVGICDGKGTKLRKAFPFLTVKQAQFIAAECSKAMELEYS